MTEQPSFGVLLERLSRHRGLDIDGLSRTTQVPEPALRAVLDGTAPTSSMIRRIAPALALHAADLFVMAGLAVPHDLTPLDPKAGTIVDKLVTCAIRLDAEQRRRLREVAHSLPQHDRAELPQALPAYEQYALSLGAMVVRMLRNRNLSWSSSARILYYLAGIGPLSASTVGAVGHGRKELSPELLAGFATVLAIPAEDMAALTGLELADRESSVNPGAADVAELIWDVRRLTADQMRQVWEAAKGELPAGHETRHP